MKHLLFYLILGIPIQLSAQISGTYTLIVDERASSIRFENKHSFRYMPPGKSDFLGRGTFRQHADTLTLIFDDYADPEIEDCSGYEVSYDSTYLHPDSINFELEVFDCETKELIPFCSIFFLMMRQITRWATSMDSNTIRQLKPDHLARQTSAYRLK